MNTKHEAELIRQAMTILSRRAQSKPRTKAQQAAARRNGRLGGRPRKQGVFEFVIKVQGSSKRKAVARE